MTDYHEDWREQLCHRARRWAERAAPGHLYRDDEVPAMDCDPVVRIEALRCLQQRGLAIEWHGPHLWRVVPLHNWQTKVEPMEATR